ncbi:hepatitis A virus cellular receptor 1 isoform X2 [Erinaceus europaeus]|uniref:Hepatitis A virus cellular receptor 1 isoform X2 n=1 Tax=Erinaceus europaeus TaxID=9365 RepID=A0ABM3XYY7_ERIEU|nr:hepatitis A virus cellular receptor 1 isoform X2 [Erinaceus europaeus]
MPRTHVIMHLQAAITGLILLVTDTVISQQTIRGVVGQTVTLPCSYSTAKGVTTMCWGRGSCPSSKCSSELIWTDGSRVTFWKDVRYNLKGNILEGNVSLTIEKAVQTDSGQYCCRVEHSGWFNDMKLTLSLEIQAVSPSFLIPTTEIQPTIPQETTRPPSSPMYSCTTDGNGTVTQSSEGLWHNNQTDMSLVKNPSVDKQLIIIISIVAVILITLLAAMIVKKYLNMRSKEQQINMASLNGPHIGALQNAAGFRVQAEDNIYIVEDDPYVVE